MEVKVYKRVTSKWLLIELLLALILAIILSLLLVSYLGVVISVLWTSIIVIFNYSLDKEIKKVIIIPILFLSLTGYSTGLYFIIFSYLNDTIVSLTLASLIFMTGFIGSLLKLKKLPFVKDGMYKVEDAKIYYKKKTLNTLILLSTLAIITIIFGLIKGVFNYLVLL